MTMTLTIRNDEEIGSDKVVKVTKSEEGLEGSTDYVILPGEEAQFTAYFATTLTVKEVFHISEKTNNGS